MSRGPILDYLDSLEEHCSDGDITLTDIFKVFGANGHYFLIVFLIIPFLQPIPLWGLSTPFGILIGFVSTLAYLNKAPWVPERWAHKKLPSKTISLIAEGSERVFEKLSFLIKSRWPKLFEGPFKIINTFILVFCALLLALPLPIPFSNAMPAWAILFQALAQIEKDGAFALLSYVQTIATIVFFIVLSKGAILSAEWLLH